MNDTLRILGIPGSLRQDSHNRQLLELIGANLPARADVELFDLTGIPLFNEDIEHSPSTALLDLWAATESADGLLFATPEYNQGIAGVMKNLVDWLSRAPRDLLDGKPVAVTGTTVGTGGTRIAQQQLRSTLSACGALVMPPPMLFIAGAGRVEAPAEQVTAFGQSLVAWTRRVQSSVPTAKACAAA